MDYDKNSHGTYNNYPNVCFVVVNDSTKEEKRVFDLFLLSKPTPTISEVELEYVGEILFVNTDSTTTRLEKTVAQIKREPSGSLLWFGVGKKSEFLKVGKKDSPVSFHSDEDIQFIVRGADNDTDPTLVISMFQYEDDHGSRIIGV